MKKIIIAAAFGILFSGVSIAQTNQTALPKVKNENAGNHQEKKEKTPEKKATKVTQGLHKKLTLTADQQARIQAITLQRIQASEAIKAKYKDSTTPDKGKHSEMAAIHTTWESQLKGILTPDQFTTYEKSKKDKKENQAADGKQKGKGKKDLNG